MKIVPKYGVWYDGERYSGGEAFEINPSDKKEMQKHGTVVEEPPAEPKKAGRPRKDDAKK